MMAMSVILSGCTNSGGNGGSGSSDPGSGGEGAQGSTEAKVLKVAFFQGGYGDAWFKELKQQFEAAHDNVTVELEGDPGIMEKMDPRFESGSNLPDVAFLTNTHWQMWATRGYLADLTDLYEGESADGGAFKDTMNEVAQQYAVYRDKAYVIPWSDGILSMVYNKGMFEEKGWTVPETWADLLELAPQIRAEGIAPIVFPGKVIGYWDFVVKPMIVQAGGFDTLEELLAMESPEVFENEAILQALTQYESLFKGDLLLSGSEALNHTEAQMEFVNGKAAMIPNGNWLEGEMKSSLPEGFDMAMMKVPALDGAKEKDIYFSSVGDIVVVPAKAKEQELAREFIKFASSQEMNRSFTELTGGFRPFTYTLDGLDVGSFTQSVMDIMQNNRPFTFNTTSPMFSRMGMYPSGDAYGNIAFGSKSAKQQYEDDIAFAKSKWDEYKKELGLE
ncbi:ABC carbohydrate transporter substrate-binding [Paenibacillus sp. 598K]|nr:ABC carbohydrate transporter substrate-binding [Paenibacillus sp. 598K]